ncbi:tyrosine-type recombinase/integrase [Acetobacter thailandicus]|uniref:tyrosine-type recombinase/integrase n=1 Tax=Acetobacter thailandicus TaxID=1502842 RepID=UPI002010DA9F|nr:tyrosine-type recombinase/integrase [Acetobacter thailandicus]
MNGFYNVFKDWCASAELPVQCSPHGLRKTAGRRLAEAGCTPHQIAAILGHKTLAEVMRYTRSLNRKKWHRKRWINLRKCLTSLFFFLNQGVNSHMADPKGFKYFN